MKNEQLAKTMQCLALLIDDMRALNVNANNGAEHLLYLKHIEALQSMNSDLHIVAMDYMKEVKA